MFNLNSSLGCEVQLRFTLKVNLDFMPRKARIIEKNIPIHVTQRGNNRQDIFKSDEDKAFYIKCFMQYKRKFKVKVYAWCLMDNHVHFVLEPTTLSGVSKMFQALNTKYVMYFNSKHKQSGRLFGDRFFSCLLDEDHLFEAIRYVELNPYRAKLENLPGVSYQWTSARERLGLIKTRFLSSVESYFSVKRWSDYLKEPIEQINGEVQLVWKTLKKHTQRGIPVGSTTFMGNICTKFNRTFTLRFRETLAWKT